jgi:2-oxoglutarate ferredoxin oxidoreductase subunit alpha
MIRRIKRKLDNSCEYLPEPIIRGKPNARIGIIAMGSTDPALIEAQDQLEEAGIPADYLRVRALPSCSQVREFLEAHERVYVVELNRDGQLFGILQQEQHELSPKLISLAEVDGLPMTAIWVREQILAKEQQHG